MKKVQRAGPQFYNGSEMVGFARDDQHYRVHSDWLSSVRSVTDQAGNTVFSASYGPWGEQSVTDNVPNGGLAMRWIGGRGVRRETGPELYYMRNRFYDSAVRIFVSRDRVRAANAFIYAGNNPLVHFDPLGLKFTLSDSDMTYFTDLFRQSAVALEKWIQWNVDETAYAWEVENAYSPDHASFDKYFNGDTHNEFFLLDLKDFLSDATGFNPDPFAIAFAIHSIAESNYKQCKGFRPGFNDDPNDPGYKEAHAVGLAAENEVLAAFGWRDRGDGTFVDSRGGLWHFEFDDPTSDRKVYLKKGPATKQKQGFIVK